MEEKLIQTRAAHVSMLCFEVKYCLAVNNGTFTPYRRSVEACCKS